MRIVLDTNVLVAAAYNPRSAARRIVEACLEGTLTAVASKAVRREYEYILARAVRVPDYQEHLALLVDGLQIVKPRKTPRVVRDDPDDDKLLAAAVAGGAEWLVTSDRHLLALDPYRGIRIAPAGQLVKNLPT